MTVAIEKPVRVQRKRTKGYRLPPNTVSVTRPGKWGNPFIPGEINLMLPAYVADKRHAYQLYAAHAPLNEKLVQAARKELKGKNLACFCPLDQPCHADVLLKIANSD